MTAWSAKVLTSSICASVKGATSVFQSVRVPSGVPSHRYYEHGAVLAELLRLLQCSVRWVVFSVCQHIGDVHHAAFEDGPAGCSRPTRSDRVFLPQLLEANHVVVSGYRAAIASIITEDQSMGCAAEPGGGLNKGVEHGS